MIVRSFNILSDRGARFLLLAAEYDTEPISTLRVSRSRPALRALVGGSTYHQRLRRIADLAQE